MERYINADKLYDYLMEMANDEHNKGCFPSVSTVLEDIADYIAVLDGADIREVMNSAWIPVSERLPEENQKCLITTRWQTVLLAEYRLDYFRLFYAERWDFETKDVTAWMPIPEPYRGDE